MERFAAALVLRASRPEENHRPWHSFSSPLGGKTRPGDKTSRPIKFGRRFYLLFWVYFPVVNRNHGPCEAGCRSEFSVRK
jgi:hypothetical protein